MKPLATALLLLLAAVVVAWGSYEVEKAFSAALSLFK